jgi:anaerobic selenocysteine-containing dehydrogenase
MTTTGIAPRSGLDRRDFLKTSAAAMAAFASFFTVKDALALTVGENVPDPAAPGSGQSIRFRFSNCQNCHGRCGLMAKVVGPAGLADPSAGVLVKLDGHPYHPNNKEDDERLPYATDLATAARTPGRLCPKGQSGIQALYNPMRIKRPLRRVGARGSGKWQAITWSQALAEIADRINRLIPVANRLTTPIDPAQPDLGPIANGLCFAPGRSEDGQIIERIFKNTWGTANYRLDHTSICETSHHGANELMTWDVAGKKGRKNHFKPDVANCEFLMVFGGNFVEANFPMVALARKVADFKKVPGRTLVVVDPRLSNTAAKANHWIPARPGTDGAVALAMVWRMIQRILNGDLDAQPSIAYLKNPNAAAATTDGEFTWTDATRLVVIGMDPVASGKLTIGKYLRWSDLTGVAGDAAKYVVWTGGAAGDASTAADGDLLPGPLTIPISGGGSAYCKTVLDLLKEEIYDGRSVEHYASIAGVDADLLRTLADQFLAAGKKAVANAYRGTVQHTNGLYAQMSVNLLNILVGNLDWKGGNSGGGGGYSFDSGMKGTNTSGFPKGPRIDRAKAMELPGGFNAWYQANYPGDFPAKRPWGPFWTHGNFQEAFLGMATGYPYPVKVLISYWNAWPYSTPGLRDVFISAMADESRIPLHVSISTTMGEVEAYADYILPETTYLEKWTFPGNTPTILTRMTNFRQPLTGSFDGRAWDAPFDPDARNDYRPIFPETRMLDDILLDLMRALGLSKEIGTGAGGLNDGPDLPVNAWAHAKRGLENLATSAGATREDIIAKGGAYQDPGNAYEGAYLKSRYANEIKIYSEELATTIDSMGTAAEAAWDPTTVVDAAWTNHLADVKTNRFPPLAHWAPTADVLDRPIEDLAYPFQLITYKSVLHGQARTIDLPWLSGAAPENFVAMNASDAAALGIRTYDRVRISSASKPNGAVGRAKVTECVRPGVVAVSHHFGHWEHSSKPHYENDVQQPFDTSRALGIQVNPIMRLDPHLGDVSLQDKVGGSCSFNDTRVAIEKVPT